MKKISMGIIVLLMGVLLVACSSNGKNNGDKNGNNGSASGGDKVVFDLSIPEPEDAKFGLTAKAFKEELETLSDGKMSIKIHANNSLGGEREVFESMGMGAVDMAIQSAGPMGNWNKEFNILDLPFLFDNREHVYAVLDGEIGDKLNQMFEDSANVKILGWIENGFVATTSDRAINSVEDVEKLKIRVQENEIQIDTWKAFGAEPTPMAWTEVFTGLQQGVIHGHSNSLATVQSSKIYEVQSHIALLEDRFSAAPISISTTTYGKLTDEQKEILEKAAAVAVEKGRQFNQDKIDEAYDFLIEEGIEITEPDKESFRAKTDVVYEKWAKELGEDLIEEIRNFEY